MSKTVAQKMGIKENARSILINALESVTNSIKLPRLDLKTKLIGEFDYILFFVVTQKEFNKTFSKLKDHLKDNGAIWVSWPKGGKENTDLNIKSVIKLGYEYGMVESKCLKVDDTWSALKFTYPKKGKEYQNSYGQLKE